MRWLFTILVFMYGLECVAQFRDIYWNDSICLSRPKEIADENLINEITVSDQLPIGGFVVRDIRNDTSYMGIRMNAEFKDQDKIFEKVNMEEGVATWMKRYINRTNRKKMIKGGPPLVCFIKQLRVVQVDSLNRVLNMHQIFSRMKMEVEGYLLVGNIYYPALRMDTLAVELTPNNRNFSILGRMVTTFAAKVGKIDTEKIMKRKGYSKSELDERYAQRFNKPILTENVLQAGVYQSFIEFVKNKPSILAYDVTTENGEMELLIKNETGEWVKERSTFGYCDGQTIWINVHRGFRPLIRLGFGFEFIESQDYWHKNVVKIVPRGSGINPTAIVGSLLLSSAFTYSSAIKDRMAYQLNMENGEVW